jgi:hypothetical protein
MDNKTSSAKKTINPYFLGLSKLKGDNYIIKLFDDKYRLRNDTLFFFLNDTAIIPGIEKYNLGDSIRLLQVEKYDTLTPHDRIKVKYGFPKEVFSFIVVYYTFNDLTQMDNNSLILLYERKRRKAR